MRRTIALFGILLLPLLARAQEGAMEFGVDGNVGYILTDNPNGFETDNPFVISLPITGLRFGYFVTDVVSIEPAIALQFVSTDGDSYLDVAFAAGCLYHFSSDPAATRPYVRIAPSIRVVDSDGSRSQFGITGQVGIKAPLRGPLAAKLALGVKRDFDNDDFLGATTIFGSFGLSFFVNR